MDTMKALKVFADWKPKKNTSLRRCIKNRRAQEGCNIWHNPQVEIVEMPIPKIGPTEILIKVKACGICGSDVLMAWPDNDGYTRYPYIMGNGVTIGHEFSGRVVEIGEGISKHQKHLDKKGAFKIDDLVTAQCVIYCGQCRMCKARRFDDCLLNEELGFSIDGAMAEYVKVDARYAYSLETLSYPASKNLHSASALIEPLAGVHKAIYEIGGGLKPGDNIVIFGGGPIGLSAVAVSRTLRATIILIEPSFSRRSLGFKMGATHTLDSNKQNIEDVIMSHTNGRGAQIYFDATGKIPEFWPLVNSLLKRGDPGSCVVCFGHGTGTMNISHETLIGTYAKITGSHGHSGNWEEVIGLVSSDSTNGIDPTKMITKVITPEETPKWLEILRTNKKEGKVIIKF